ncbi:kinase-like domain-containing protein [Glomus cerebriforme]|uniref:Kinase-like domain-containing protein n=1 Tax=Glomus cerebriforme TaxID=658196 RepID=A0A397SYF7_9GLOM|nr:kinase-like domain-containing protein [Glomus cerebriforme]
MSFCDKCGYSIGSILDKWCKTCQINYLQENFTNWTSGNQIIDNFIQEIQLKINNSYDIIFEWIPYTQFDNIKETDNVTIYSATWKDGSLYWNWVKYIRISNKSVILKYSDINELLNEAKKYSITYDNIRKIYGISQNPDTNDYIMVLQNEYCEKCGEQYTNERYRWCLPCQINYLKENFTNWTSENEIIDNYIQKMQLKINKYNDIIFEWIPYTQFDNIKETGNATIYSATWKDGSLIWDLNTNKYIRISNKSVTLKCLNANILNEVKKYSIIDDNIRKIYGISQNLNTNNYIMILHVVCEKCGEQYTDERYEWCRPCQINYLKENFTNWTSENQLIDNFTQEMQLNIKCPNELVFEWISYNQFSNIKEIGNTLYSALWKDGSLEYDNNKKKWIRVQSKEVVIKYFHSLQVVADEFLDKVKVYKSDNIFKICGISQQPDTKDYIMIFQKEYYKEYGEKYCEKCIEEYTDIKYKSCKPCQINDFKRNLSGNEKIDKFIQEIQGMQLKTNNPNDTIFEWISYNQFNIIKEIGKGGFATVYSAIWNDGPLRYVKEWKRRSDKKVALKCLHNSQNMINEFLNEIRAYSMNKYGSNIIKIYGISQDPETKNYIIILQCAEGGNFNDWIYKCYKDFDWHSKLRTLFNIINGLCEIHKKKIVHCDFHPGNILIEYGYVNKYNDAYISDMGLCGEIGNTDESKIYGIMSYVAPEVLRGGPYTQAADIYSFGMIMYFAATGKQPFSDCAHDEFLALNICKGARPEINEQEAPKCYIDLMKKCWDSNPNNRPNVIEIENYFYSYSFDLNDEIKRQFKKAEEYRKVNLTFTKNNQSATHPQAVYISRLLNPFTKRLPKYDDHSECLDCSITD